MKSDATGATPFGLNFRDGRVVVGLARPHRADPVRFELLDMEIPDLTFPFDMSGGVERFRNYRGNLVQGTFQFDGEPVSQWLNQRVAASGAAYERLSVRFLEQCFELTGKVNLDATQAEFLLRGFAEVVDRKRLRLCINDIRLFAPFPVAAPLVASGLISAIVGDDGDTINAERHGATDISLDPLRVVLLNALPHLGWRLPNANDVRLIDCYMIDEQMNLHYARPNGVNTRSRVILTALKRGLLAHQEAKGLFASLEQRLLDDPPATSLEVYCQQSEKHANHPLLIERQLQLMCTSDQYDERARKLALDALTARPAFATAYYAMAMIAERNAEYEHAAHHFSRIADLALERSNRTEELFAVLAAARCATHVDQALATTHFERALRSEPNHAKAMASLARLYGELGRWDSLVEIRVRQIEQSSNKEARLHHYLALGELFRVHLKQHDRARASFEQALAMDASCEPALRGLAETFIDTDDHLRAINALDRLADIVRRRGDLETEMAIHLRIASLWEHLADRANALARIERALTIRPSDQPTLQRKAHLLLAMNQYRDAALLFEDILQTAQQAPPRLDAHQQLAQLYLGPLQQTDAAEVHLQRALALEPANQVCLTMALELADERGEQNRLLELLQHAAAAESEAERRSALLLRRGLLLAAIPERHREAREVLSASVEGAPDQGYSALSTLAQLYTLDDQMQPALRALEQAAKTPRGRQSAELLHRLAELQLSNGALPDARATLITALSLEQLPPNIERRLLLAQRDLATREEDTKLLTDANERILPLLQHAEDQPLKAAILRSLAESYQQVGLLESAAEALGAAAEVSPGDPILYETLAEIHERLDNWAESKMALSAALELTPAQTQASARIYLRLAGVAQAERHLDEALHYYELALVERLDQAQRRYVWNRMIAVCMQDANVPAAAATAERAALDETEPQKQADRLVEAGQLWLKQGEDLSACRDALDRAILKWPGHRGALDVLESLATKQSDDAALISVLERKIETHSRLPSQLKGIRTRLAHAYQRVGRAEAAAEQVAAALESDANYLPALALHAKILTQQGKDAIATHQQLADRTNDISRLSDDERQLRSEALRALATHAQREEDVVQQEALLLQILALDPADAWPAQSLQALYTEQGRLRELTDLLERQLSRMRSAERRQRVGLDLSALQRQLGRDDDARRVLRQLRDDFPLQGEVLVALIELKREQAHDREFLDLLLDHAELLSRPSSSDEDQVERAAVAWTEAAGVARGLNDHREAQLAAQRALEIAPQHLPAIDHLIALSRSGTGDESLEKLLERRLALALDETDRAHTLLELVACLERRGAIKRALSLLADATDHGASNPLLWYRRAQLERETGDTETAQSSIIAMRDLLGPDDDKLDLDACRLLLLCIDPEQQITEQIEEAAMRLVATNPHDAIGYTTLRNAYVQREDWSTLASLLQRALGFGTLEVQDRVDYVKQVIECFRKLEKTAAIDELIADEVGKRDDITYIAELAQLSRRLGLATETIALKRLLERVTVPLDDDRVALVGPLMQRAYDVFRNDDADEFAGVIQKALTFLPSSPFKADIARRVVEERKEQGAAAVALAEPLELKALVELQRSGYASNDQIWRLAVLLTEAGEYEHALALLENLDPSVAPGAARRALHWQVLAGCGRYEQLAQEQQQHARQTAVGGGDPSTLRHFQLAARTWLTKVGDIEKAEQSLNAGLELSRDASPETLNSDIAESVKLLSSTGAFTRTLKWMTGHAPSQPTDELIRLNIELQWRQGHPLNKLEPQLWAAISSCPRPLKTLKLGALIYQEAGLPLPQCCCLRLAAELSRGPEQRPLLGEASRLALAVSRRDIALSIVNRLEQLGHGEAFETRLLKMRSADNAEVDPSELQREADSLENGRETREQLESVVLRAEALRKSDLATTHLQRLIPLLPRGRDRAAAQLALSRHEPSCAIAQHLAMDRDHEDLWIRVVRIALEHTDGDARIEPLCALLDGRPTNLELIELADLATLNERHALAARCYALLFQRNPRHPMATRRVDALIAADDPLSAVGALEELAAAAVSRENRDLAVGRLMRAANLCAALGIPLRQQANLARAGHLAPNARRSELLEARVAAAIGAGDAAVAHALLLRLEDWEEIDTGRYTDWSLRLADLELEHGNLLGAQELAEATLVRDAKHIAALQILERAAVANGNARELAQVRVRIAHCMSGEAQLPLLKSALHALREFPHEAALASSIQRQILQIDPNDASSVEIVTELLRRSGDNEALSDHLWQRASRHRPTTQLLLELGHLEQALSRPRRASRALELAVTAAPEDERVWLELLATYKQCGDLPRMIARLEKAIDDNTTPVPLRAKLLRELADAHLSAGENERALHALTRACAADSTDEGSIEKLVRLARRTGAHEVLAEYLDRWSDLAQGTKRANLKHEAGQLFASRLQDPERAAASFEAAYQTSPGTHLASLERAAEILSENERHRDAERLIEDALARSGTAQYAHALLLIQAKLAKRSGDVSRAANAAQQALETRPDDLEVHQFLADLYIDGGELPRAIPHLKQVSQTAQLVERRAAALAQWGRACLELGSREEAISRCQEAIALHPGLREALEVLASCYSDPEHASDRIEPLRSLLHLTPGFAEQLPILVQLAKAYRQVDDSDAAYRCYQRILELSPDHVPIIDALHQLTVERGEWAVAAELQLRLAELAESPEEQAQLRVRVATMLHERLGQTENALEQLREAMAAEPASLDAKQLAIDYLEQLEMFSEAAQLAQDIASSDPDRGKRRATLARAADLYDKARWTDEAQHIRRELRRPDRYRSITESHPTKTKRSSKRRTTERKKWIRVAEALRTQVEDTTDPQAGAELRLKLANIYEDHLGRGPEALALYEEALALTPHNVRVALEVANVNYRYHDWERARELYAYLESIEHRANTEELQYRHAVCTERTGNTSDARALYEAILERDPEHRGSIEGLVRVLLTFDEITEAIQLLSQLDRIVSVDEIETRADVKRQIGALYLKQQHFRTAREYLEAAHQLRPSDVKLLEQLTECYRGLNDHAAVAHTLTKLAQTVREPTRRAELLFYKSHVLRERLDDADGAIDCLLRAYDLTSRHAPTLAALIDYYWSQADWQSTAELADDLHAIQPEAERPPSERNVRVAGALWLADQQKRAIAILKPALSKRELARKAVVEAGTAIDSGFSAEAAAELLRSADDKGFVRTNIAELARDHGQVAGLNKLQAQLDPA